MYWFFGFEAQLPDQGSNQQTLHERQSVKRWTSREVPR